MFFACPRAVLELHGTEQRSERETNVFAVPIIPVLYAPTSGSLHVTHAYNYHVKNKME